MKQDSEYFVFISYSSLDNEWAIWLRHELEHYHLPASFNGRTDVRDNLRKVFRDRDELSAGPEWDDQVKRALANTNNLIVICSPHSAKSDAVNKEIETFIALGKEDYIFPFIVEGDKPKDCFPPALKHSKLGGDIKKDGSPNIAFIKIVAGMLKVDFSELWNRYEIEKAEEERKIREQRDNLLRFQSRFLAEKANDLFDKQESHTACLLVLEILPKELSHPNRPYTSEAENALRTIFQRAKAICRGYARAVSSFSFSSDGKNFVSASGDNTIRIWNVDTGLQVGKPMIGHKDTVRSVFFSPDGKYVVSASKDKTLLFWDTGTGQQVGEPIVGNTSCSFASISHDGKYVVSAWYDNTIRIWDTNTRLQVGEPLRGHKDIVRSVSFSPDCKYIVSASKDKTIRIWDAGTGRQIGEPLVGHTNKIHSASFSPDGKHIVSSSSDRTIRIWDADTRALVGEPLVGHSGCVLYASYSPDGKYVVSASRDNTIRIWNAENGHQLGRLLVGHGVTVFFASFSPDGKYILSASNDKFIRIWDFPSLQELIDEARERFKNQQLTPDERKKYYLE